MTRAFAKLCIAASLALVSSLSLASDSASPAWADPLKRIGQVYSNPEGGVVQSVRIFGRLHTQWNYSDGESAGDGFNSAGEELRRLRVGGAISFLDGYTAVTRVELEEGGFRDTDLGYGGLVQLYLQYQQQDWLGFDTATAAYGRFKLLFGGEHRQSSNRIKTIERSAINNRFGRRPTGFMFNSKKDGVEYLFGVWSREPQPKYLSGWDDGVAIQVGTAFDALKGKWNLDFVYADNAAAVDSLFNYKWASSTTYNRDAGRYHLLMNFTFSNAGDVDPMGLVVLPSFFISNKLEAAFRYQWANSSTDTGAPLSSSNRGIRAVARKEGFAAGSGDNYHALYAGLNYYIAGDNVKLMTGIEYESIRGNDLQELHGVSFWFAGRVYF